LIHTVLPERPRASDDRALQWVSQPTRRDLRQERAGGTTAFARLRGNAATAGIVLASAGLLLGAVAPSATTAATPAAGMQAVTAAAEAPVTFTLEGAGRAVEGVAPGIASARARSASLTPALQDRKAFGAPVDNPVLASTFGHRVNPVSGAADELHEGLDYSGACGTPVKAADAGTVVDSGWHAYGGGQRIVVDHGDGLKTTYNHLSALDVQAGTKVKRGDVLGAVGSTGNSTGCHLHFEVMVDDKKVDPKPWL
jgi:murein DD-endopeptidase MepM/ murein hydrolase activator NlpD